MSEKLYNKCICVVYIIYIYYIYYIYIYTFRDSVRYAKFAVQYLLFELVVNQR